MHGYSSISYLNPNQPAQIEKEDNKNPFENLVRCAKNGDASAYDCLRHAAESGVVDTYVPFANLLMTESEVYAKDPAEAVRYYIKAAELGVQEAYMPLGQAYQLGIGTEMNGVKAANNYYRLAKSGDANGYLALGQLYRRGACSDAVHKILPWPEKAMEYFEKAADMGSIGANVYLGELHEQSGDSNKADIYYRKAIAFLSGALININHQTDAIILVPKTEYAFSGAASDWVSQGLKFIDTDGPLSRKAFLCFDMAANMGDKDGWEHLGAMHEENGTKESQGKAIRCYRQAYDNRSTTALAKLENLLHPALFEKTSKSGGYAWIQLGALFETGDTLVPPNLPKAAECYQQLIGSAFDEDASHKLAKIHAPDKLNDPKKMVDYYRQASTTSSFAARELAKIYHCGSEGIPADPVLALKYYVIALEPLKNPAYVKGKFNSTDEAKKIASTIRSEIREVLTVKETESMKNNPAELVKCLQEASTFSPFAAKALAKKYRLGQGVTQDHGLALKYYKQAHDLSDCDYFVEGCLDTVPALPAMAFKIQVSGLIVSLLHPRFEKDESSY